MKITVTAFLFAERNVKVNHGLKEPRKKFKEPRITSEKSIVKSELLQITHRLLPITHQLISISSCINKVFEIETNA